MTASLVPNRPAWIEVDLAQLRANFSAINAFKPADVGLVSVLKDNAYGHGAVPSARVAIECGASHIALVTIAEAVELRDAGINAPILMLGQRHPAELDACLDYKLTPSISELATARAFSALAAKRGERAKVHIKIDTGMSRYGIRWSEAVELVSEVCQLPGLELEGIYSHFAMSDELDKTFALLQLDRFSQVVKGMRERGLSCRFRHMCNSGGLLDLPPAHFDLVRCGILPLGVYPSKVCRRIDGIAPAMSVKTRIAHLQRIQPGDTVGYGMRYKAESPRTIAVLPIGYGDGFPRVRNQGGVLIRGIFAPLVGGVSMDAITVDVTAIPGVETWDEAVVQGRQGDLEISVHDLATMKNSVSYDVLTSWSQRLPRIHTGLPK